MRKETKILLNLFSVSGKKGSKALTKGQVDIFENIVYRKHNRVQIESCTQYGKSLVVALASIIVSCIQDIIIPVVAPTTEKAKIIMRYYIEHLGDSPIFSSQLDSETKLDRLRQEESKSRIILKNGGGIYTLSTNERNFKKSIESAMGAGGQVTVIDEAGLIRDETEATIYRMIAGKKNAFYCKIGNPFYRAEPYSHFFKSHSKYKLLHIDYKQAIKEKRYSKEFIEEAKEKPMFEILYECIFPAKEEIDEKGFRFLLTDKEIENCFVNKIPDNFKKEKIILGGDIGEGNDYSVYSGRGKKFGMVMSRNKIKDTMQQVPVFEELLRDNNTEEMFIDSIGVGSGPLNRAVELGLPVYGIKWGKPAVENDKYANIKAENFWNLKLWIQKGGKILYDEKLKEELKEMKYKIKSDRLILMEPKEDLKKRLKRSPDRLDSFALTFNVNNKPDIDFL